MQEVSVNSIAENRSLLEGKRRELLEERQQWEAKVQLLCIIGTPIIRAHPNTTCTYT